MHGGRNIKRILRSQLPERLAGKVPPLLVEFAIGIAVPVIFVAARAALVPLLGDRAPYAFNFLAVVTAAVLAGWRSGLVALAVGQTATWFVIVQPQWGGLTLISERLGGLIVATISELLTLCVIALFQREISRAWSQRERRMELLDQSLSEIDHRTRNNYQTVLALIQLQAQRTESDEARVALRQVSDRITALSVASERLALRSEDLGTVPLANHLRELCAHVERALSREEIVIECEVDDVGASADKATAISIVVNELLTNAIKHAFNGRESGHVQVTGKSDGSFELIVSDDGRGMQATRWAKRTGLGTRLVDSFVRQLGAVHEVTSSDQGTTHRLTIPNLE